MALSWTRPQGRIDDAVNQGLSILADLALGNSVGGRGRASREAMGRTAIASTTCTEPMKIEPQNQWICTRQMTAQLGVHRVTLQRLKSAGYFRSGHHFRKANPSSHCCVPCFGGAFWCLGLGFREFNN